MDKIINFLYKEITASNTAEQHAINNNVPYDLYDNMLASVVGMQKVRELLGKPCKINSWFRCEALNKLVGGQPGSHHKLCLAIDFVPIGMTLEEAIAKINNSNIPFDQLILERNKAGARWIHISFAPKMRRQCFELLKK